MAIQKRITSKIFGKCSRYRLDISVDRFGTQIFSVWDAEKLCPETNLPDMIRCETILSAAIEGLEFPKKEPVGNCLVVNLDTEVCRFHSKSDNGWVLVTESGQKFLADPEKCFVI